MPEWDVDALGVMGWCVCVCVFFSATAVAVVVATPKVGVCWQTVSSPLGLGTEISACYCLETTRTGVPQFLFHYNATHL